MAERVKKPEDGSFDWWDPSNVAALVAYLGSNISASITGQVFEIGGGKVSVCDGWRTGPTKDKGARWEPSELGPVVEALVELADPPQKVWGS